jgi:ParB family transcriptional regulator, chromosome partitioning protein
MAKRVLGKGLMALLDDGLKEDVLSEKERFPVRQRVMEIPFSKVKPNAGQPRKDFTGLEDLIASIKEKGILQPLLVREKNGIFEIIAGERRYRASQTLKLEKIPAIVLEADEEEALELTLIENIQRKDLNPVEEARGYKTLIERFNLTQEEAAKKVGKERSSVTNALRLLSLPEKVLDHVSRGTLSPGHAKVLLSLKSEPEQVRWMKKILEKELSVRSIEELIYGKQDHKGRRKESRSSSSGHQDVFLRRLENKLEEFFSTKVRIQGDHKKGRIEVQYFSMDDLERIKDKIEDD